MPKQSKATSAGGQESAIKSLTDALSGLSGGIMKRRPELDELEKQLKKSAEAKREILRKSPKGGEAIMADLLYEAENAFIEKDLKRDLRIKDPAQLEEYRQAYRAYVQENLQAQEMVAIVQSGEWGKLTAHVEQLATYAKLDEIIAKCETTGNSAAWEDFKEKHPMLAMAGSWIISWHLGDKEKKDYTKFDKKLEKIAGILGDEEGKEGEEGEGKDKKDKKKGAETAPEAIVLSTNQKEAIKPLQDAGFEMDLSKVEEDMNTLIRGNKTQEQIVKLAQDAIKDGSNFSRIAKVMQKRVGAKNIQFRLTDIGPLGEMNKDQVGILIKVIASMGKKPKKMRMALNEMAEVEPGDTTQEAIATKLGVAPKVKPAESDATGS